MKVARKTPSRRLKATLQRATLTLSAETYRSIDQLRGNVSRSAWVGQLVEKEQARLERERFIEEVNRQYTPEICRQTLALNDEYPIHES